MRTEDKSERRKARIEEPKEEEQSARTENTENRAENKSEVEELELELELERKRRRAVVGPFRIRMGDSNVGSHEDLAEGGLLTPPVTKRRKDRDEANTSAGTSSRTWHRGTEAPRHRGTEAPKRHRGTERPQRARPIRWARVARHAQRNLLSVSTMHGLRLADFVEVWSESIVTVHPQDHLSHIKRWLEQPSSQTTKCLANANHRDHESKERTPCQTSNSSRQCCSAHLSQSRLGLVCTCKKHAELHR